MGTQHPKIQALHAKSVAANTLAPFRVGDTVRVHYKVVEGDKERIQVFQGQVIRERNGGIGSTFTVRKISYNVGVERIFPRHSPRIDKVEVVAGVGVGDAPQAIARGEGLQVFVGMHDESVESEALGKLAKAGPVG